MAAQDDPEELILWDVVEEHLDEATFLFSQFESLLDHPLLTRADLERSVESRLIAHLDGLVVGGASVAQRLLLPALSEFSEEGTARIVVAAMALLLGGHYAPVRSALFHPLPEICTAVARACSLIPSQSNSNWAVEEFRAAKGQAERQAQLLALGGRRLEARELIECLSSENRDVVCAALDCIEDGAVGMFSAPIGRLLKDADRRVRLAALRPALAWGLPSAKSVLRQLAQEQPAQAEVMALHAMLNSPQALDDLRAALETPTHRQAALFALGYCGRAEAVPLLMDQIRLSLAASPPMPLDAKLALQSIALLTGLDLNDEVYAQPAPESLEEAEDGDGALPPLESEDLDRSLVPVADEALPLPNPDAVEQFWQKHREQLAAGMHYLRGRPLDTNVLQAALEQSPLRVQHVLASALYVFTAGATRKDTRCFGMGRLEPRTPAA